MGSAGPVSNGEVKRTRFISVIIPNHNGARTIGECLKAVFASRYDNYEVVVVDDCSSDESAEIIRTFPCRIKRLEKRMGASAARNAGVVESRGEVLFFTDADCLPDENALQISSAAIDMHPKAIIGGTYTPMPADTDFYSRFQSVLINCFETWKQEPDYIAAHAMIMERSVFSHKGGFAADIFWEKTAGIEDVEFSHRMRRAGYRLVMNPDILVTHRFNFNLVRSFMNALGRSRRWTFYSLKNGDLLTDSGAAAIELKYNVFSWAVCACIALAGHFLGAGISVPVICALFAVNFYINRSVIAAFFRLEGANPFFLWAVAYYFLVYPIPVGTGGFIALLQYISGFGRE